MVICPNCLYKNMTGAIFCSECGAQLVKDESQKTASVGVTDGFPEGFKPGPTGEIPAVPVTPHPDAPISLHILGSGAFVPLPDEEEVVLGRAIEGQSMVPDVNLEPYRAFEYGVSRIHAAIRTVDGQVSITDLGSGNGTRINGNKIEPHTPQPVKNGDLINLGKLKVQIIIQGKKL